MSPHRYTPSILWVDYVRRWFGVLYNKTLVSGGARGVRLKSKAPFRWVSVDSHRFIRDGQKRLSVGVT